MAKEKKEMTGIPSHFSIDCCELDSFSSYLRIRVSDTRRPLIAFEDRFNKHALVESGFHPKQDLNQIHDIIQNAVTGIHENITCQIGYITGSNGELTSGYKDESGNEGDSDSSSSNGALQLKKEYNDEGGMVLQIMSDVEFYNLVYALRLSPVEVPKEEPILAQIRDVKNEIEKMKDERRKERKEFENIIADLRKQIAKATDTTKKDKQLESKIQAIKIEMRSEMKKVKTDLSKIAKATDTKKKDKQLVSQIQAIKIEMRSQMEKGKTETEKMVANWSRESQMKTKKLKHDFTQITAMQTQMEKVRKTEIKSIQEQIQKQIQEIQSELRKQIEGMQRCKDIGVWQSSERNSNKHKVWNHSIVNRYSETVRLEEKQSVLRILKSGLYFINAVCTGGTKNDTFIQFALCKNNTNVVWSRAYCKSKYSSGVLSMVLKLKQNDTIRVGQSDININDKRFNTLTLYRLGN